MGDKVRKIAVAAAVLVMALLAGGIWHAAGASASTTPVANRPAMGYNPWYEYDCGVTEGDIVAQAQDLASSGLAAAGYTQVNLDDCWMNSTRSSSGQLEASPGRFPHGIAWLAAQVHSLGLKFGVYEAIGTRTCKNYPGSYGHYAADAKTFASWGVDYVKVDDCGGLPAGTTEPKLAALFQQYGSALRSAMPGVTYSQELPVLYVGTPSWLPAVDASPGFSNLWRMDSDESGATGAPGTIMGHLAADLHLHGLAGPGHWNDMDMLVTGTPRFGWTLAQEQAQMSVWAQEASPLLLSTGVLTTAELAALKNPYLITVDQSGQQAPRSVSYGHVEALVKPYPGGGESVCFTDTGSGTASGHFTLSQLGIGSARASGYDIWTGRTTAFGGVSLSVAPGTARLLIIKSA